MSYYTKIIKESIIVVILSSSIGLISGSFLSANEEIFYALPIILLILPSLNSLIGDIATVLISRLTSHLYIGSIEARVTKSERLIEDFYGLLITIILSLIVLIILGFSLGSATNIDIVNPFLIILILFMTILLLFGIMFISLFIGAIIIFKKGRDPNNFLIPFITSLADFLTPFFLIIFIITFI